MKKINFEKLSDKDLFGKLKANKLLSSQSDSLRGGTSTTLCNTVVLVDDADSGAANEDYSDPRCHLY